MTYAIFLDYSPISITIFSMMMFTSTLLTALSTRRFSKIITLFTIVFCMGVGGAANGNSAPRTTPPAAPHTIVVEQPSSQQLRPPLLRQQLRRDFAQSKSSHWDVSGEISYESMQRWVSPLATPLLSHNSFNKNTGSKKATSRQQISHQRSVYQTAIALQKQGYDIPLKDHALVKKYIEYFTGRGRKHFVKWLARAGRYKPMMVPILKKMGLPQDTFYLAMIESGLASRAYSSAAASGFWQFIPSTGKMYKLRQDHWQDERRDFVLATKSAGRYLKRLHREFGTWHLAWAAYNAGEGRIRRTLKKHLLTTFWQLANKRTALPTETRHYVPKIIAAAIVAKNAQAYGFNVTPQKPLRYDTIKINKSVDLKTMAKQLHVSIETLRTLNPALLRDVTPPQKHFKLRIPKGESKRFARWVKHAKKSKQVQYAKYTIKRGDNLHKIAKRYRSDVHSIVSYNKLKKPSAIFPGQRLTIPSILSVNKLHRNSTKNTKRRSGTLLARHTVKRGDTLWSLARHYQVSIGHIKNWNKRSSSHLGVGDVIKIYSL